MGNLAGFVLVNEHHYVSKALGGKSIAEFFVMKKYRRKGVGKKAALLIFKKYPGKWEVNQHGTNEPSKLFWENLIRDYTNGNYQKETLNTEEWAGQALLFNKADSEK